MRRAAPQLSLVAESLAAVDARHDGCWGARARGARAGACPRRVGDALAAWAGNLEVSAPVPVTFLLSVLGRRPLPHESARVVCSKHSDSAPRSLAVARWSPTLLSLFRRRERRTHADGAAWSWKLEAAAAGSARALCASKPTKTTKGQVRALQLPCFAAALPPRPLISTIAMPRAGASPPAFTLALALAMLLAPTSAMRSQLPSAAQAAPRPPRSLLLPQFSLSQLQVRTSCRPVPAGLCKLPACAEWCTCPHARGFRRACRLATERLVKAADLI
eukprot:354591-Chlamydomonas_euryale.AAC.3